MESPNPSSTEVTDQNVSTHLKGIHCPDQGMAEHGQTDNDGTNVNIDHKPTATHRHIDSELTTTHSFQNNHNYPPAPQETARLLQTAVENENDSTYESFQTHVKGLDLELDTELRLDSHPHDIGPTHFGLTDTSDTNTTLADSIKIPAVSDNDGKNVSENIESLDKETEDVHGEFPVSYSESDDKYIEKDNERFAVEVEPQVAAEQTIDCVLERSTDSDIDIPHHIGSNNTIENGILNFNCITTENLKYTPTETTTTENHNYEYAPSATETILAHSDSLCPMNNAFVEDKKEISVEPEKKFDIATLSYDLQNGYKILISLMGAGNRFVNKLFINPVDDNFPETAEYYNKIQNPMWMRKSK